MEKEVEYEIGRNPAPKVLGLATILLTALTGPIGLAAGLVATAITQTGIRSETNRKMKGVREALDGKDDEMADDWASNRGEDENGITIRHTVQTSDMPESVTKISRYKLDSGDRSESKSNPFLSCLNPIEEKRCSCGKVIPSWSVRDECDACRMINLNLPKEKRCSCGKKIPSWSVMDQCSSCLSMTYLNFKQSDD